MRSGAAAGHTGFFHQTAFYGSDEEFLAVVRPFVQDGLNAGEPVVAAFAAENQALLRKALPRTAKITFIDGDVQYARPANAVGEYSRMMAEFVAAGAEQVRVAGDVPHPGLGVPWDWWARYEAAANVVYAGFPMWGLCPYDTRTTPDEVLGHVRRSHPHIATAGGDIVNPEFRPQDAVPGRAWSDPIEATSPVLVLVDPLPSTARAAVAVAGRLTGLSDDDTSGLMLAVSEVLSNGIVHGRGPTRVRLWTGPDRVVVTVTDQGVGPADPYVGLMPVLPASEGLGGQGLWLAHQLCSYMTMQRDAMGFTVRMVAGRVPAPLLP
jgi:anti-sigma regulatory factor (Ser/Thr protein kinase)